MNIRKEHVRAAVENRYLHNGERIGKTEREIENMVALVESVLDVTRDMGGWSAAEVHSIAASACQRQIYEESKR